MHRNRRRPRRFFHAVAAVLASGMILAIFVFLRTLPGAKPTAPTSLDPVPAVPLGPAPEGGILHREILQATHARRIGDRWAVADWRAVKIHLLDEEGGYLGAFGRDGDGPGEFRRPQALGVEGDSLLIVLDERRGSLERFRADGTFLDRRELTPPACLISFPLGIEIVAGETVLLHNCARTVPPGLDFVATLIPRVGQPRRIHHERGLNFSRETTIRFAAVGASGKADPTFWWALSDRPCLQRIRTSGEHLETRCFEGWAPVLVPDSVRRKMEGAEAPAARGLRIVAPEHYPAMERVFHGDPDPIILSFLGEDARALERVAPDGSLTRLRSDLPAATFVDGSQVLEARQELEGTRIWISSLDQEWP